MILAKTITDQKDLFKRSIPNVATWLPEYTGPADIRPNKRINCGGQ